MDQKYGSCVLLWTQFFQCSDLETVWEKYLFSLRSTDLILQEPKQPEKKKTLKTVERFPCMAANRVLHVLGCRDQTVQHAKPNQKVQAWGKCFSGLDGRRWVALASYPSLAEPHLEEPFCLLQRAVQSVDGVSIPLCPHLAHLPCFWSGSADVPSFIPWSPCLLMSLAKALHCIWSDCNS